jgi:hypothetical protein
MILLFSNESKKFADYSHFPRFHLLRLTNIGIVYNMLAEATISSPVTKLALAPWATRQQTGLFVFCTDQGAKVSTAFGTSTRTFVRDNIVN